MRRLAGAIVASTVLALGTAGVATASQTHDGAPFSECGTVSGLPSGNVQHLLKVNNSLGIPQWWKTDHAVVNGGSSSLSDIQVGDVVRVDGTAPGDGDPDADSITEPATCS